VDVSPEQFRDIYERNGRNAQRTADALGVRVSTLKGWDAYRTIRAEQAEAARAYKPKILFLDIETKPAIVYSWGMFDQNHSVDQVISDPGTICFGAKWQGESKVQMFSDWEHGHEEMVRQAHRLFTEADAIVTYNGDRFDIPRLQGEFLLAGLPPPPPVTSIDVYKTIKKMGYLSSKLAYIAPRLVGEGKLSHDGFAMWVGVMNGDEKMQRKMGRYCAIDVRRLEEVYDRIKAYIANHPHMGETGSEACGACGSRDLVTVGAKRSKSFQTARVQCRSCGSWQSGKRTKAAA
jgi:uncharacterized protein YprB with RNaseH-like and TPR domain